MRTLTPAWLRLVPSLVQHADTLANLEPLDTIGALQAATAGPIAAARKDAAAAGDAAWDAAGDAAGAALADTVTYLQGEATQLVRDLCAMA